MAAQKKEKKAKGGVEALRLFFCSGVSKHGPTTCRMGQSQLPAKGESTVGHISVSSVASLFCSTPLPLCASLAFVDPPLLRSSPPFDS
jgi:hypothetical protein